MGGQAEVSEEGLDFGLCEADGFAERLVFGTNRVDAGIVETGEDAFLAHAKTPGENGFFEAFVRVGRRLERFAQHASNDGLHVAVVAIGCRLRERHVVLVNEKNGFSLVVLGQKGDEVLQEDFDLVAVRQVLQVLKVSIIGKAGFFFGFKTRTVREVGMLDGRGGDEKSE